MARGVGHRPQPPNRAVGEDFPGTLGVRRDTVLAMGRYDGAAELAVLPALLATPRSRAAGAGAAAASRASCRCAPRSPRRHQAVTPSSRSDGAATSSQCASMKRAMSSSSARFVRATVAVSPSPAIVATRSRSW